MRKLILISVLLACPQMMFAANGRSMVQSKYITPSAVPQASIDVGEQRYWAEFAVNNRRQRTILAALGMSIDEVLPGSVRGVATKSILDAARAKGFNLRYSTTLENYAGRIRRDFPSNDALYHNYTEVTDTLKEIATKNPDIARLFSIGKSSLGRELWALHLTANVTRTRLGAKPGAVFIGTHHAREHLSTEVPLMYAMWLAENKNRPDVQAVLAKTDIYILPLINPDGSEYDISTGHYKMWRKNFRKIGNTVGVDINRNYPHNWCQVGASSNPGSDTYCGPNPFSEPETQAVKKFYETVPNIKTTMSYHTYGRMVMYPWGDSDDRITDQRDYQTHKTIAEKLASLGGGYTPMQSNELYLAGGDMNDWTYDQFKIISFTTELDPDQGSGGGFYPGAAIIQRIMPAQIQAAFYLASISDNPYQVLQTRHMN